MTRQDLLGTNASIVRRVVSDAVEHSPDVVLVVLAEPLDAMCHVAVEASGLPKERVVGQGGMLDTGRFRTFSTMETAAATPQ
jgi:malate dehydrogenase